MKAWKSLAEPRVGWEAFKRMVGQMGLEKAVETAGKMKHKRSKR